MGNEHSARHSQSVFHFHVTRAQDFQSEGEPQPERRRERARERRRRRLGVRRAAGLHVAALGAFGRRRTVRVRRTHAEGAHRLRPGELLATRSVRSNVRLPPFIR